MDFDKAPEGAARSPTNDGAEEGKQHVVHLESMRDYYRRTAGHYNSAHCQDGESSHNYAVRQVLRTMTEKKLPTLLDVCCGTGRCISAALAAGFDARGLDASPDLLQVGIQQFGLPQDRLHCADATKMPFPDKSFDVACILGALHHSALPLDVVRETIRVTRHAIIISDEANHLHGMVRSVLKRLGIFRPVYRAIFRREPRTERRLIVTEGDGPTFDFTIEEIVPILEQHFRKLRSRSFVRIGHRQFQLAWLPRFFATQAVVIATDAMSS